MHRSLRQAFCAVCELQGEGRIRRRPCDLRAILLEPRFLEHQRSRRAVSPRHWQETKDSIRQCNAVAGDPKNPDVVAFLGWEWTQVGTSTADHYGHKNVIFVDTEEAKVPRRPISALSPQLVGALREPAPFQQRSICRFRLATARYYDFGRYSGAARIGALSAGRQPRQFRWTARIRPTPQ